ncbi:AAA-domain-containing protein [Aulographum hederae CBS 113979]|uniref:AAA-domain-containing protein n=1 Tax=Aulographum hederae CBS 113979 TaxID=1176131 RepID=A0A6G1HFF2_9PEZI|nr:AAA-domain-containing protein [Aulographum hederae CBS 113979]
MKTWMRNRMRNRRRLLEIRKHSQRPQTNRYQIPILKTTMTRKGSPEMAPRSRQQRSQSNRRKAVEDDDDEFEPGQEDASEDEMSASQSSREASRRPSPRKTQETQHAEQIEYEVGGRQKRTRNQIQGNYSLDAFARAGVNEADLNTEPQGGKDATPKRKPDAAPKSNLTSGQRDTLSVQQGTDGLFRRGMGLLSDPDLSELVLSLEKEKPRVALGPPITSMSKAAVNVDDLKPSEPRINTELGFGKVGGLEDVLADIHESFIMPISHPELAKMGIKPPRGMIFHGPPGTGKTYVAKALAAELSRLGTHFNFMLLKPDELISKWVGETEKKMAEQFDIARRTQPCIMFIDEIDGLAPKRSSGKDSSNTDISACNALLTQLDGFEERGEQVFIMAATNRLDAVDPALLRRGRLDRKIEFTLPEANARLAILKVHNKDLVPPMDLEVLSKLAHQTAGYNAADLVGLCSEASMNAMRRTYPELYPRGGELPMHHESIDLSNFRVLEKDFENVLKKQSPSASMALSSSIAPSVKLSDYPLLHNNVEVVSKRVKKILPLHHDLSTLEKAQAGEENNDEYRPEYEALKMEAQKPHRPRQLIRGAKGMDLKSMGDVVLSQLNGYHVVSMELSILNENPGVPAATKVSRLFAEIRRVCKDKPCVIYLPQVDVWYMTIDYVSRGTFLSELKKLRSDAPVLVLGTLETDRITNNMLEKRLMREVFGAKRNVFHMSLPNDACRCTFFQNTVAMVRKRPAESSDEGTRKKRKVEGVKPSSEASQRAPQEEKPAEGQRKILPLKHCVGYMNSIRKLLMDTYINMRNAGHIEVSYFDDSSFKMVKDETAWELFRAEDETTRLLTDLPGRTPAEVEGWQLAKDPDGVRGFHHVETGKFYYNMDLFLIEERILCGHYTRPVQMLRDFYFMAADIENFADYRAVAMAAVKKNKADTFDYSKKLTLHMRRMVVFLQTQLQIQEEEHASLIAQDDPVEASLAHYKAMAKQAKAARDAEHAQTQATIARDSGLVSGNTDTAAVANPAPPLFNASLSSAAASASVRASNGEPAGADNGVGDDSTLPLLTPDNQQHLAENQGPETPGPSQIKTPGPTHVAHRTQKSALERVAPNSQVSDYHNSASTTTSGQKTQSSSANGGFPDFGIAPTFGGGSQLPDTQDLLQSSQSTSQPSQPVRRDPLPIDAILNGAPESDQYILDKAALDRFQTQLVEGTAGLTIEELEGVRYALTQELWAQEQTWNRNLVIEELERTLAEEHEEMAERRAMAEEDAEDDAIREDHALADANADADAAASGGRRHQSVGY